VWLDGRMKPSWRPYCTQWAIGSWLTLSIWGKCLSTGGKETSKGLYLHPGWGENPERCREAGVPEGTTTVAKRTKITQIGYLICIHSHERLHLVIKSGMSYIG
jgi:hypothetical protein